MNADEQGQYAEVNGLKMYYETHGTGAPLILLHGSLGSSGMFGEVLTVLAETRQVIAVDLQAHGRTVDIDRPLSLEAMAKDVAALINHLGFARADLMGYSMGGGVALRVALQYPDSVRKLVVVSTPFASDGWYPEVRASMVQMGPKAAEPMKGTPMYTHYVNAAPRPEDWPVLLTKMGEMVRQDYEWSTEVEALGAPILIVLGDADSVRLAHGVAFFELVGGGKRDGGWDGSGMSQSRLAILPGYTHYTIFNTPVLAKTVLPFLESPLAQAR